MNRAILHPFRNLLLRVETLYLSTSIPSSLSRKQPADCQGFRSGKFSLA